MHLPIPEPAPVTSAILPSRRMKQLRRGRRPGRNGLCDESGKGRADINLARYAEQTTALHSIAGSPTMLPTAQMGRIVVDRRPMSWFVKVAGARQTDT